MEVSSFTDMCTMFLFINYKHHISSTRCFKSRMTNLQEVQGYKGDSESNSTARSKMLNLLAIWCNEAEKKNRNSNTLMGQKKFNWKFIPQKVLKNTTRSCQTDLTVIFLWYFLLSGRFLMSYTSFRNLQMFEFPERKEFHAAPLSSLPADFWFWLITFCNRIFE